MVSEDFDFLTPKSGGGLTEGCQTSNLTFAMDSTPPENHTIPDISSKYILERN